MVNIFGQQTMLGQTQTVPMLDPVTKQTLNKLEFFIFDRIVGPS